MKALKLFNLLRRLHLKGDFDILYFWGHGWSWYPGYVMSDDTDADALDMEDVKTECMFGQQRDERKAWVPNYGLFFFEVETRSGVKMLPQLLTGFLRCEDPT